MSQKIDRATHGPGWGQVILSAILSIVLGVIVAALLLILRPVTPVKVLPPAADRDPEAVYYIEGSREVAKSREAPAKRLAFAEGQSVTLMEDDLNALAASTASVGGSKPGDAAKTADPAASTQSVAQGAANFRLHDGALQVALPVKVNLLGFDRKVIVQSRGGFAKQGDIFAYQPAEMSIGSCPIDRVPFLANYVRAKFVTSDAIPEDVKASWAKLAKVAIEGNALKLTMP